MRAKVELIVTDWVIVAWRRPVCEAVHQLCAANGSFLWVHEYLFRIIAFSLCLCESGLLIVLQHQRDLRLRCASLNISSLSDVWLRVLISMLDQLVDVGKQAIVLSSQWIKVKKKKAHCLNVEHCTIVYSKIRSDLKINKFKQ